MGVACASGLGRGSWSCYAPDRYIPAPGIDRAAATTQNAGTLTATINVADVGEREHGLLRRRGAAAVQNIKLSHNPILAAADERLNFRLQLLPGTQDAAGYARDGSRVTDLIWAVRSCRVSCVAAIDFKNLSTANGGDLLRHLGRVRYIPKIQRASRARNGFAIFACHKTKEPSPLDHRGV